MNLDLKIGECMTSGVITLPASANVQDAAKLLKRGNIGSIIVLEGKKAAGIITERDIVWKVVAKGSDSKKIKLSSIMSRPLKIIKATASIRDAAEALRKHKVKRLPVVDKKGQLVGIITEGDLVKIYPGIVDVLSEIKEINSPGANQI